MIPKIIHYCWFSKEPMPLSLQSCINTWKETMPDYEIKHWDAERIDLTSNRWCKEAFDAKAWAFVTDYARLYILDKEGGIYLDTDVYVKRRFDDFLSHGFFTAIEYHPEMIEADEKFNERLSADGKSIFPGTRIPGIGLQAAILGAEKGHPYIKKALEFYQQHSFIKDDGTWFTEWIAPDILAITAENFNFKYIKDQTQRLPENIVIYPYDIFAGAYTQVTEKTIAVHLSKGGWRKRNWIRNILSKFKFIQKIISAKYDILNK